MDATTINTIVANLRNKLVRQKAAVKLTEDTIAGFQTIDFEEPSSVEIRPNKPKQGK